MPHPTRLAILADLVIVSAANMVIAIVLARVYSESEFAAFGIGLAVALVVQAVQRNGFLIGMMLLTENRLRRLRRVILGEHLLIVASILAAALLVALALTLSEARGTLLWLVALSTVPSLLFYLTLDFDRSLCLKQGRAFGAAAWSAAYLATVAALSAGAVFGRLSYLAFIGGLLLFSLAKLGWMTAVTGRPDLSLGGRFLVRDARKYLRASLLGVAAYAGYTHVPLFVLGYTSPPIYAAAFVAMRTMVQPLQVVIRSLDMADKHVFAQARLEGGQHEQHRVSRRLGLLYLAIGGGLAVLLCIFARPLVELVYGPKYAGFELSLYGWAAIFVILAVTLPLESVVFAEGRWERYVTTRLLAGAVGTLAAYPLCVRFHDAGATAAVLLGAIVAILSLLWFVRREIFGTR